MVQAAVELARILNQLERHYGKLEASWPTDPYEFLVWWHCGYPASDANCAKGWRSLTAEIGVEPRRLLSAPAPKLAAALKAGGMVPELRSQRLKEVARRVQDVLGGDLRAALSGSLAQSRKTLKKFPGISDPGADRILLFSGIAPVAAVPSNCPQVLVRIARGQERENYGVNYREAQQWIASEVPEKLDARQRAYLLAKRHGEEICKRSKPNCAICPVNTSCAYYARQTSSR